MLQKKIIELINNGKAYRRWPKPKRFDNNLVVIVAGSSPVGSTL